MGEKCLQFVDGHKLVRPAADRNLSPAMKRIQSAPFITNNRLAFWSRIEAVSQFICHRLNCWRRRLRANYSSVIKAAMRKSRKTRGYGELKWQLQTNQR